MNRTPPRSWELSYAARARLADNLFLRRTRAGYSQEALGDRAQLSRGGVGKMEGGQVGGSLDTYVRLAGALGITLDDLLAGVSWTPAFIESEVEGGYGVEFEMEGPEDA